MNNQNKIKLQKKVLELKKYIFKEIDRVINLEVNDDSLKINFLKSILDEYKIRASKLEKEIKTNEF